MADVSDEAIFREAIGNATPWSLDATSLASWLEKNWVSHQEVETDPTKAQSLQNRRRDFVRRWDGTGRLLLAVLALAKVLVMLMMTMTGRHSFRPFRSRKLSELRGALMYKIVFIRNPTRHR